MSKINLDSQIYQFNTQFLGISSYTSSTVVCMQNNLLHGGIFSTNNFLSEDYLLNFCGNSSYLGRRMGVSHFYSEGGLATITKRSLDENTEQATILPKPTKIRTSISQAIINRRSIRDYKLTKMSQKDLSNLLFYACGVSKKESKEVDFFPEPMDFKLRNSPSAGGIYPIKLYFRCNNVAGLDNGIYVYYPETHAVKLVKAEKESCDCKNYADFATIKAQEVNLIFFYVYDMYVNTRKYGNIGAAFAFIEAGEMAQNIQLVSTALGYGACDIGGYNKPLVERELDLDGITKHLIHVTIVGSEE